MSDSDGVLTWKALASADVAASSGGYLGECRNKYPHYFIEPRGNITTAHNVWVVFLAEGAVAAKSIGRPIVRVGLLGLGRAKAVAEAHFIENYPLQALASAGQTS